MGAGWKQVWAGWGLDSPAWLRPGKARPHGKMAAQLRGLWSVCVCV